MSSVPSFSEDMLPRHFPKAKGQLEQNPSVVPMPTLPGLSLILDDDNKYFKAEPVKKVEPKKSFEQWKQQHQAMFSDNTTTQQRRPEKKQVRFKTDRPNEQSPVSPNLELSYHEDSHGEHFCHNQWMNQQNSNKAAHFDGCENNVLLPRCNYTPASHSFAGDNACYAATQRSWELPQLTHRKINSESLKENRISGTSQPVCNDHRQNNSQNCCETKKWEMMNYQTCNHEMQPNGFVNQQQNHQHAVQPKTISPLGAQVERNLKEQLTGDTLLSIMEEQQEHILLQQNQIMMQQKQNMIQQNQIFMLQRQVQKLLLRNGITSPNESPQKHCPTLICDEPTTLAIPSALQNAFKPRNGTVDAVRNGASGASTTTRSSIGVMTSFLGNVNDGIPNGMQQFNERLTSKVVNEKFIENMVGGEYSYKDSMLDRINDAIKNSSAMIDYRNNGTDVSPDRQSDLNVAAKTVFYETSSTNMHALSDEPKTNDRSFALYMLGMKYDCKQDESSKNNGKRDWQTKQTNGRSDQVSVNLSPEVYDYLKRHGLLQQE